MNTIKKVMRRKSFRLRVWKTLNAVVGVVTILNVSLVGTFLVAPSAAVATTTIFSDNFNSYTKDAIIGSPWSQQNGVHVRDVGGVHGQVAELNAGDGDEAMWTTVNTTGFSNIVVSYDRKIDSFESGDWFKTEWRVGAGSWTTLENRTSNSGWSTKTFYLPDSASDVTNFRLRFTVHGNHDSDTGFVDNVKIESRGYSLILTSPTPPTQTDTFTWTLGGEKPGPGTEISHFSLQGCWDEKDIKSVTVTKNPPAETDDWEWAPINPPGGAEAIKINNLNDDNDLPALITVVFKQSYLSNGSVTGWIKQGRDLVSYQADGPNCATPRDPVTINAWKIICPNESDLPNWGTSPGGSNITASTAAGFVAANPQCSLAQGWDFQWGYSNVVKDNGDHLGPATTTGSGDSKWKNFDTSSNGVTPATVSISNLKDFSYLWVRENLQAGYIPFASPPGSLQDSNSAELYCHQDVLNYDNYDRIDSVAYGKTYNCVAFNVLSRVPSATIKVSKMLDADGDGTFETSNPPGWSWSIDNGPMTGLAWGETKEVSIGDHTVRESFPSEGFHFEGWYKNGSGYTCETLPKGGDGNQLPIEMTLEDNDVVDITLCNAVNTYGIHGQKWNDLDGDGYWNENTGPMVGWTFYIDAIDNGTLDPGERSTQVDTSPTHYGWYWFDGLVAGTYKVCEQQQTGWQQTSPKNSNDNCHTITLPQGDTGDTCFNPNVIAELRLTSIENAVAGPMCNFGNQQQASVTVVKNVDMNGDGDLDDVGIDVLGATDWTWDVNGGNQNYATGSTQTITPNVLTTVTEDQKLGYTMTGVSCALDQAQDRDVARLQVADIPDDSFFAQPGSSWTCTFTNQRIIPTMTLVKSATETIAAGDNITYTMAWAVTNGGVATNVVLTDPLPTNTTFVSADNGGTESAGIVTWNLGTKNPGESGTVTLVVKSASPLDPGTVITNTATLAADLVTPISDTKTTTTTGTPTLSLAKVVDDTTLGVNQTVNYTITWSVGGNSKATNVIMTDALPETLNFVSASNGGTYDVATRTITWNLGTKNPGESGSVTVVATTFATMANGITITNNAAIDSAQTDPKFASAVATSVVPPVPQVLGASTQPKLSITKTANVTSAKPGSTVTYKITVTNNGDGDATNVVVTDTIPTGLSFVGAAGKTNTWEVGTLSPMETKLFTVEAKVENGATGSIVNVASAAADGVTMVKATATVKVPSVLGLSTTGAGMLDYLIALMGAAFIAFGVYGLTRQKRLRVAK